MQKYINPEKRAFSCKVNLPNKSKRQKDFLSSANGKKLSFSEAVDSARLIPKALVSESIIVAWPDE